MHCGIPNACYRKIKYLSFYILDFFVTVLALKGFKIIRYGSILKPTYTKDCTIQSSLYSLLYTRVNKKVKEIFKLRGNRDREELAHCAVLTMPVEEFCHVQYSALPSVEWQQRGRKHGRSFARLHHRRTTWRSGVSLGRRNETCGNSPSYVGSVWTEHHESTKGL